MAYIPSCSHSEIPTKIYNSLSDGLSTDELSDTQKLFVSEQFDSKAFLYTKFEIFKIHLLVGIPTREDVGIIGIYNKEVYKNSILSNWSLTNCPGAKIIIIFLN